MALIIDHNLKSNASIKESVKALIGETLSLTTTVASATKIATTAMVTGLLEDNNMDVRYNPESGVLAQTAKAK